MERTTLGFITAPAAAIALIGGISGFLSKPDGTLWSPDPIFFYAALGIPAAYTSEVLFGIPIYLLFRRKGWLKLWQTLLAGVVCSAPLSLVAFHAVGYSIPDMARWLSFLSTFGVITALIFWYISVRNNTLNSFAP